MSSKRTSSKVAKVASKNLRSPHTGAASKSSSGSALAQKGTNKTTSSTVAKKSSKVLQDARTSNNSKSAAGSALSQRQKRKK